MNVLPVPQANDAAPAQILAIELETRIATQRLHYRSGDEETAAASLHKVFLKTRDLLSEHLNAPAFRTAALFFLNHILRPNTAQRTTSLLSSMERLTAHLTASTPEPVSAMPPLSSIARSELLARYHRAPSLAPVAKRPPRFYISYAKADNSLPIVRKLANEITARFGPESVFWDEKVPYGAKWEDVLQEGLLQADNVLVAVGPQWEKSIGSKRELEKAIELNKSVTPVLLSGTSWSDVPPALQQRRGLELGPETIEEDIRSFVRALSGTVSEKLVEPSVPVDPDDPQKGQWGGQSERDGRRLRATVGEGRDRYAGRSYSDVFSGWFMVQLIVEPTDGHPLEGEVEFHLHPSFNPPIVRVPVQDGRAILEHYSWGAFTVGALADNGHTRLELDLATLSDAPNVFRAR